VVIRGCSAIPAAYALNDHGSREETDVTGQTSPGPADPSDSVEADSRFNIGVAHVARVYDYWLGGYFL
jgi:hypothetical protein